MKKLISLVLAALCMLGLLGCSNKESKVWDWAQGLTQESILAATPWRHDEEHKSEDQTHYMPIFMCLGMSLGTAIGVATDNLSIYMPVGISIGLCIGSLIDAQRRNKAKDAHNDEETE